MDNVQQELSIEVSNVKKSFKSYMDKATSLKERFLNPSRVKHKDVMVLKGVSFHVRRGEAIGIVGKNGCGKSTMLKLLTKILYPDEGQIQIRGRVSSLIELGAGFHPDMTGKENIYTNASIFGLTRKEVNERMDEIIRFSELEDFIYEPVRTYSSGMYMRLAFAVAINVDADILLIDEILAVGDTAFQKKCFEKLKTIKENGTTIVIVSHSMEQMYKICDRLIWLEDGIIREEGVPKFIGEAYLAAMEGRRLDRVEWERQQKAKAESREEIKSSKAPQAIGKATSAWESILVEGKDLAETADSVDEKPLAVPTFCCKSAHRVGDGAFRIVNAWIRGCGEEKIRTVNTTEPFSVVYEYESSFAGTPLNFVISFTRSDGVYCFGTGSISGNNSSNAFLSEERGSVNVFFEKNNLLGGKYLIDLGIQSLDGIVYDYIYSALELIVVDDTNTQAGLVNMPRKWECGRKVICQEY